jgi:cobalt/nickel transport system permease protein
MADALISPAVGGTMWAASAGLIGYCSKKVKDNMDDITIPLMGVVGAFIFAARRSITVFRRWRPDGTGVQHL